MRKILKSSKNGKRGKNFKIKFTQGLLFAFLITSGKAFTELTGTPATYDFKLNILDEGKIVTKYYDVTQNTSSSISIRISTDQAGASVNNHFKGLNATDGGATKISNAIHSTNFGKTNILAE